MNIPEIKKKWPKRWFVVMCNGYSIYATLDGRDANSLCNRLVGSLNKSINQVDIMMYGKNPTVWQK